MDCIVEIELENSMEPVKSGIHNRSTLIVAAESPNMLFLICLRNDF